MFILSVFSRVRVSARVRFFMFFYFSLVFISFLFSLYRVSGSGARGLIKAPAGVRGLAPVVTSVSDGSLGSTVYPPALAGGHFRGGSLYYILDIYRLTDTGGGSLGGFYGVR